MVGISNSLGEHGRRYPWLLQKDLDYCSCFASCHLFQRGWKHQPGSLFLSYVVVVSCLDDPWEKEIISPCHASACPVLRRHFDLKSPLHFMSERTRTASEWEDLSGRSTIFEHLFRWLWWWCGCGYPPVASGYVKIANWKMAHRNSGFSH